VGKPVNHNDIKASRTIIDKVSIDEVSIDKASIDEVSIPQY
jgi:hypothetical protein